MLKKIAPILAGVLTCIAFLLGHYMRNDLLVAINAGLFGFAAWNLIRLHAVQAASLSRAFAVLEAQDAALGLMQRMFEAQKEAQQGEAAKGEALKAICGPTND